MGTTKSGLLPDRALNLTPRKVHAAATEFIRNWPILDLKVLSNAVLRRSWQPHELRFVGSPDRVRATGAHELMLAYASLRVGSVLFGKSRARDLAKEILEIGEDITSRLRSNFSLEEFRQAATGGRPGLKDALLYGLVRFLEPKLIVETGVAQGVSSTFLLSALERNGVGQLISIDLPNYESGGRAILEVPGRIDRTYVSSGHEPGWLVPERLRSRWHLMLGSSKDVLPTIQEPVDLFFHDSLHTYSHMTFEFNWAMSRLLASGYLVSDDIYWNSAFGDLVAGRSEELHVLSDFRIGVAQRMTA